MTTVTAYEVDAFTSTPGLGNRAGVVPDADGLNDLEMQEIARVLGHSETAFICSSPEKDADVWVRFFTPTIEVPICGHATIAAHFVNAKLNELTNTTVTQKTGAGVLPVGIEKQGEEYLITMTQGEVEMGNILNGTDKEDLLQALGIEEQELDARGPIQIVSTGHSKVMIGINSRETLNSLQPDQTALKSLSERIGCKGYFVFTFDSGEKDVLTSGRMFAPAIGIAEDPVTGNANGPLGAYLVEHALVPIPKDGENLLFTGKQGEAIGRSGKVQVSVFIDRGLASKVKVSGIAVMIPDGKRTFRTEELNLNT